MISSRSAFRNARFLLVILLELAAWKLLDASIESNRHAWVDQYPNRTDLISKAVQAGTGTYDLFSIFGEISAVCISFAGVDPRQLAATELHKDLVKLQGNQPFFTVEGIVSIKIFGREDRYRIEEFDKDVMVFSGGPIKQNMCVDHPKVASLKIDVKKSELTLAKMTAKIDLQ